MKIREPTLNMNVNRTSTAIMTNRGELLEEGPNRKHESKEGLVEVYSPSNAIFARRSDPPIPRMHYERLAPKYTASDRLDKKLRPRVTFSEKSVMQVYLLDRRYASTKSYTREDCDEFGCELLSEAMRIKRLMIATPGASTKDSFMNLIKENTVSIEEIVGIEQILLGKSASKPSKVRQDHARAVLEEQDRQRFGVSEDDPIGSLGRFSASRSTKSARRARTIAAMAA